MLDFWWWLDIFCGVLFGLPLTKDDHAVHDVRRVAAPRMVASYRFESVRSLSALMMVLLAAALGIVASVIVSMMVAEIDATRTQLLGSQLDTIVKALVASLGMRMDGILDHLTTTANRLEMDPSLAVTYPAVTDTWGEAAAEPLLGQHKGMIEAFLATMTVAESFHSTAFFHRNGRLQAINHFQSGVLGPHTGLWDYLEQFWSPSGWYMRILPMGKQAVKGLCVIEDRGFPSIGYVDIKAPFAELRALDASADWGAIEENTGHSLGRVQLLADGTLIDHTTCEAAPPPWNTVWNLEQALRCKCSLVYDGAWAYNESGARELRRTSTNESLGKDGNMLAAGSVGAGAWQFTYALDSKKCDVGCAQYLPYAGHTRPYFADQSDVAHGGTMQHATSGFHEWYGPYAIPGTVQLIISPTIVVHTRIDGSGNPLIGGRSTFAGVLLADISLETISVFMRAFINSLDLPPESLAASIAFVVTEPPEGSNEQRVMVAASNVQLATLSTDQKFVPNDASSFDRTVYTCEFVPSFKCGPALMNHSSNPLISEAAKNVTRQSFVLNDDVYIMRTLVYDRRKLRWRVGVIVPEKPYTVSSRRRTTTVIGVAIGISLTVLLLWGAMQESFIARPLSQVSRGIKALGEMRLDDAGHYVPRTSSAITTIDVLLRGFHASRGSLLEWRTQETQRRIELEAEKDLRELASVRRAQGDVAKLVHPMVLVSAAEFMRLGKLTSYEVLRTMGKLTFLDTLEQLNDFKLTKKVLFLSHQWLGWGVPDPQNVHYMAMVAAIGEAVRMLLPKEAKDTAFESVYVWVDFGSIAQEHRGMQVMAITALPVYSAYSDAFIVIAPHTTHSNTCEPCGLDSYATRGWCRAEMLSKVCGSGLKHMYVFETNGDTNAGGTLQPVTLDWLSRLSLHVFDGRFSCCALKHQQSARCDKEELALPMLGLYSLVLQQRDQPHMVEICRLIDEDKQRFFPNHIEFETEIGSESRPLMEGLITRMEQESAVCRRERRVSFP